MPHTPSPPRALFVERPRRLSLAWILPLLSLGLAIWFGLEARAGAGLAITVRASEGHGIDAGDAVRFRGIEVGVVEGVRLSRALDEVVLDVVLEPFAAGLAREGTGFWIARPHLALESVVGLETLFGARYLAVLAGPVGTAPQRSFRALEEAPAREDYDDAGLLLVLEAPARFGLAPGAPLLHRGVEVGNVTAVDLAADAARVEVQVYVAPEYVPLIRANTRFWEVGGAELSVGLTRGLHLDIENLRTLLVGGVAFATPEDPGAPVEAGHRFALESEEAQDSAEWRPALGVGRDLASDRERQRPALHSLRLTWKEGRVFKSEEERRGWGVVQGGELIAPVGLLVAHKSALEGTTIWWMDDRVHTLLGEPLRRRGPLAAMALPEDLRVAATQLPTRPLEDPEACIVIADPEAPPIALDASRLTLEDELWRVDERLAVAPEWNGAPVLARSDGALLGLLVVDEDEASVAPLP